MSSFDAFFWMLFFPAVLAAGAILLAWMPPGMPGGRRPRDWAAMAAASLLLGCIALRLIALLGGHLWIGLALLAASFVVRIASRPLPLAPRHEPLLPSEPTSARFMLLLAWIGALASLFGGAILVGRVSRADDFIFGTLTLAVLVLVDWALDVARCRALVRAAAISAFGAVVVCAPTWLEDLPALAALFFAAGAACTIAWYRRGDRRALTLAAVYFGAPMSVSREGWLLAAAGMLTLVIGTARPSRIIAGATCAVAAVLFGAARLLDPLPSTSMQGVFFSNTLYAVIGVLFAAVLAARWMDVRGLRLPAWNSSGAAVGHERAMLLRTLLFALVFAWIAKAMRLEVPADFALLPALFVLVLLFGSSLERLLQRA